MPAARTSMVTSPGPGGGSSTVTRSSTSGPPKSVATHRRACTNASLPRPDRVQPFPSRVPAAVRHNGARAGTARIGGVTGIAEPTNFGRVARSSSSLTLAVRRSGASPRGPRPRYQSPARRCRRPSPRRASSHFRSGGAGVTIGGVPPSFLPDLPVLAAPMAGGPGTLELVAAAAKAGSMGFLAAGYKTADAVAGEIAAVDGVPFGVNLFAPNPLPVDLAEFRSYARVLAPEADRYGITLPATPVEDPPGDPDGWHDKIDVLRAHPVGVVSFTFGIPPAADLAALRATGAVLVQTVTSAAEARAAAEAGLDALVVQSAAAGG